MLNDKHINDHYPRSGTIVEIVTDFERGTLPLAKWTHEAFLTILAWYVYFNSPDEACVQITNGIRRNCFEHGVSFESFGVDVGAAVGFWVGSVAEHLDKADKNSSFLGLVNGVVKTFRYVDRTLWVYSQGCGMPRPSGMGCSFRTGERQVSLNQWKGGSKMKTLYVICAIIWVLLSSAGTKAQVASGGSFTMNQTVTAAGGSSNSSGGDFAISGTTGQAAAGARPPGSPFSLQNGFWTGPPLATTAAMVSVSGKVTTPTGRGLFGARVRITNSQGTAQIATTGSFGYFRFDSVRAGEVYVISVVSKRFQFVSRVVMVTDSLADVDFVGQ